MSRTEEGGEEGGRLLAGVLFAVVAATASLLLWHFTRRLLSSVRLIRLAIPAGPRNLSFDLHLAVVKKGGGKRGPRRGDLPPDSGDLPDGDGFAGRGFTFGAPRRRKRVEPPKVPLKEPSPDERATQMTTALARFHEEMDAAILEAIQSGSQSPLAIALKVNTTVQDVQRRLAAATVDSPLYLYRHLGVRSR